MDLEAEEKFKMGFKKKLLNIVPATNQNLTQLKDVECKKEDWKGISMKLFRNVRNIIDKNFKTQVDKVETVKTKAAKRKLEEDTSNANLNENFII